ncbi:hypothetical protein RN001_001170 [Aquatica leii]|uniref:MADF domain-containing protein n=1 Tax=Aquatica leii TaxID=1421715 RepID=A0AAN7Q3R2_9COLE|nr:hypothetical protein RN001_001170 [Aquatica leii]
MAENVLIQLALNNEGNPAEQYAQLFNNNESKQQENSDSTTTAYTYRTICRYDNMRGKPEDLSFLISFVQRVHQHPCLWNYKLIDYSKPDVTALAWKSIATELQDTEQNCRERWTNVRCAFVRSLKPHKSGSRSKLKKPYYLAEHLSFLIPYIKRNNTCSELTTVSTKQSEVIYIDFEQIHTTDEVCKSDPFHDDQFSNEESSNSIGTTTTYKKIKIDSIKSDANTSIVDGNIKTQNQNTEDDADLFFFRSLLPDFKKLDDRRKRNLKSKFISLLNYTLDEAEYIISLMTLSTNINVRCGKDNDHLNLINVSDFDDIVEYTKTYDTLSNTTFHKSSFAHINKKYISTSPITIKPTRSKRQSNIKDKDQQKHLDKNNLNKDDCNDLLSKISEYNELKRKLQRLTVAFKQRCSDQNYDEFVDSLINSCLFSLMNTNLPRQANVTPSLKSIIREIKPLTMTRSEAPFRPKPLNHILLKPCETNRDEHENDRFCCIAVLTSPRSLNGVKLKPISCKSLANLKDTINEPRQVVLAVPNKYTKNNVNDMVNSQQIPNFLKQRILKALKAHKRFNFKKPVLLKHPYSKSVYGIFYPVQENVLIPETIDKLKHQFSEKKYKNKQKKENLEMFHGSQKSILKKFKYPSGNLKKKGNGKKRNTCIDKELQYLLNAKTILNELTELEACFLNREQKSGEMVQSSQMLATTHDDYVTKSTLIMGRNTHNTLPNFKKCVPKDIILKLHQDLLGKIKKLNDTVQKYKDDIRENVIESKDNQHSQTSQHLLTSTERNLIVYLLPKKSVTQYKTVSPIRIDKESNSVNYREKRQSDEDDDYGYDDYYDEYNFNSVVTTSTNNGNLTTTKKVCYNKTTRTTEAPTTPFQIKEIEISDESVNDPPLKKANLSALLYGLNSHEESPTEVARFPISIPVVGLGERYFFTIGVESATKPSKTDSDILVSTTTVNSNIRQVNSVERLERDFKIVNQIEKILQRIKKDRLDLKTKSLLKGDDKFNQKEKNDNLYQKRLRLCKKHNRNSVSKKQTDAKLHHNKKEKVWKQLFVNDLKNLNIRTKRNKKYVISKHYSTDILKQVEDATKSNKNPSNDVLSISERQLNLESKTITSPLIIDLNIQKKQSDSQKIVDNKLKDFSKYLDEDIEKGYYTLKLSTTKPTTKYKTSTHFNEINSTANSTLISVPQPSQSPKNVVSESTTINHTRTNVNVPINLFITETYILSNLTSSSDEYGLLQTIDLANVEITDEPTIGIFDENFLLRNATRNQDLSIQKTESCKTISKFQITTDEPNWAMSKYIEKTNKEFSSDSLGTKNLFTTLTPQIVVQTNINENNNIFILKTIYKEMSNANNLLNNTALPLSTISEIDIFLQTLYESTTTSSKIISKKSNNSREFEQRLVEAGCLKLNKRGNHTSKKEKTANQNNFFNKISLLSETEELGMGNKTLLLLEQDNNTDKTSLLNCTSTSSTNMLSTNLKTMLDEITEEYLVLHKLTTENVVLNELNDLLSTRKGHNEVIESNMFLNLVLHNVTLNNTTSNISNFITFALDLIQPTTPSLIPDNLKESTKYISTILNKENNLKEEIFDIFTKKKSENISTENSLFLNLVLHNISTKHSTSGLDGKATSFQLHNFTSYHKKEKVDLNTKEKQINNVTEKNLFLNIVLHDFTTENIRELSVLKSEENKKNICTTNIEESTNNLFLELVSHDSTTKNSNAYLWESLTSNYVQETTKTFAFFEALLTATRTSDKSSKMFDNFLITKYSEKSTTETSLFTECNEKTINNSRLTDFDNNNLGFKSEINDLKTEVLDLVGTKKNKSEVAEENLFLKLVLHDLTTTENAPSVLIVNKIKNRKLTSNKLPLMFKRFKEPPKPFKFTNDDYDNIFLVTERVNENIKITDDTPLDSIISNQHKAEMSKENIFLSLMVHDLTTESTITVLTAINGTRDDSLLKLLYNAGIYSTSTIKPLGIKVTDKILVPINETIDKNANISFSGSTCLVTTLINLLATERHVLNKKSFLSNTILPDLATKDTSSDQKLSIKTTAQGTLKSLKHNTKATTFIKDNIQQTPNTLFQTIEDPIKNVEYKNKINDVCSNNVLHDLITRSSILDLNVKKKNKSYPPFKYPKKNFKIPRCDTIKKVLSTEKSILNLEENCEYDSYDWTCLVTTPINLLATEKHETNKKSFLPNTILPDLATGYTSSDQNLYIKTTEQGTLNKLFSTPESLKHNTKATTFIKDNIQPTPNTLFPIIDEPIKSVEYKNKKNTDVCLNIVLHDLITRSSILHLNVKKKNKSYKNNFKITRCDTIMKIVSTEKSILNLEENCEYDNYDTEKSIDDYNGSSIQSENYTSKYSEDLNITSNITNDNGFIDLILITVPSSLKPTKTFLESFILNTKDTTDYITEKTLLSGKVIKAQTLQRITESKPKYRNEAHYILQTEDIPLLKRLKLSNAHILRNVSYKNTNEENTKKQSVLTTLSTSTTFGTCDDVYDAEDIEDEHSVTWMTTESCRNKHKNSSSSSGLESLPVTTNENVKLSTTIIQNKTEQSKQLTTLKYTDKICFNPSFTETNLPIYLLKLTENLELFETTSTQKTITKTTRKKFFKFFPKEDEDMSDTITYNVNDNKSTTEILCIQPEFQDTTVNEYCNKIVTESNMDNKKVVTLRYTSSNSCITENTIVASTTPAKPGSDSLSTSPSVTYKATEHLSSLNVIETTTVCIEYTTQSTASSLITSENTSTFKTTDSIPLSTCSLKTTGQKKLTSELKETCVHTIVTSKEEIPKTVYLKKSTIFPESSLITCKTTNSIFSTGNIEITTLSNFIRKLKQQSTELFSVSLKTHVHTIETSESNMLQTSSLEKSTISPESSLITRVTHVHKVYTSESNMLQTFSIEESTISPESSLITLVTHVHTVDTSESNMLQMFSLEEPTISSESSLITLLTHVHTVDTSESNMLQMFSLEEPKISSESSLITLVTHVHTVDTSESNMLQMFSLEEPTISPESSLITLVTHVHTVDTSESNMLQMFSLEEPTISSESSLITLVTHVHTVDRSESNMLQMFSLEEPKISSESSLITLVTHVHTVDTSESNMLQMFSLEEPTISPESSLITLVTHVHTVDTSESNMLQTFSLEKPTISPKSSLKTLVMHVHTVDTSESNNLQTFSLEESTTSLESFLITIATHVHTVNTSESNMLQTFTLEEPTIFPELSLITLVTHVHTVDTSESNMLQMFSLEEPKISSESSLITLVTHVHTVNTSESNMLQTFTLEEPTIFPELSLTTLITHLHTVDTTETNMLQAFLLTITPESFLITLETANSILSTSSKIDITTLYDLTKKLNEQSSELFSVSFETHVHTVDTSENNIIQTVSLEKSTISPESFSITLKTHVHTVNTSESNMLQTFTLEEPTIFSELSLTTLITHLHTVDTSENNMLQAFLLTISPESFLITLETANSILSTSSKIDITTLYDLTNKQNEQSTELFLVSLETDVHTVDTSENNITPTVSLEESTIFPESFSITLETHVHTVDTSESNMLQTFSLEDLTISTESSLISFLTHLHTVDTTESNMLQAFLLTISPESFLITLEIANSILSTSSKKHITTLYDLTNKLNEQSTELLSVSLETHLHTVDTSENNIIQTVSLEKSTIFPETFSIILETHVHTVDTSESNMLQTFSLEEPIVSPESSLISLLTHLHTVDTTESNMLQAFLLTISPESFLITLEIANSSSNKLNEQSTELFSVSLETHLHTVDTSEDNIIQTVSLEKSTISPESFSITLETHVHTVDTSESNMLQTFSLEELTISPKSSLITLVTHLHTVDTTEANMLQAFLLTISPESFLITLETVNFMPSMSSDIDITTLYNLTNKLNEQSTELFSVSLETHVHPVDTSENNIIQTFSLEGSTISPESFLITLETHVHTVDTSESNMLQTFSLEELTISPETSLITLVTHVHTVDTTESNMLQTFSVEETTSFPESSLITPVTHVHTVATTESNMLQAFLLTISPGSFLITLETANSILATSSKIDITTLYDLTNKLNEQSTELFSMSLETHVHTVDTSKNNIIQTVSVEELTISPASFLFTFETTSSPEIKTATLKAVTTEPKEQTVALELLSISQESSLITLEPTNSKITENTDKSSITFLMEMDTEKLGLTSKESTHLTKPTVHTNLEETITTSVFAKIEQTTQTEKIIISQYNTLKTTVIDESWSTQPHTIQTFETSFFENIVEPTKLSSTLKQNTSSTSIKPLTSQFSNFNKDTKITVSKETISTSSETSIVTDEFVSSTFTHTHAILTKKKPHTLKTTKKPSINDAYFHNTTLKTSNIVVSSLTITATPIVKTTVADKFNQIISGESTCNLTDYFKRDACVCSIDNLVSDLRVQLGKPEVIDFENYDCPVLKHVDNGITLLNNSVPHVIRFINVAEFMRNKREVIQNYNIEKVLAEPLELKTKAHDVFAIPGKKMQIPCVYSPEIVENVVNYSWIFADKLLPTEGRVQDHNGVLTIDNVTPQDGGNYTCFVMTTKGSEETNIKYEHHVFIVSLPTYALAARILYNSTEQCQIEDTEILSLYFPSSLGVFVCGSYFKVCKINVSEPQCLSKFNNYLMLNLSITIELLNSIIPGINTSTCDVNCEMAVYSKIVTFVLKNLETIEKLPIYINLSYRQEILIPVNEVYNQSEVIITAELPRLIISCPPGFGYYSKTHLCGTCKKNTYSSGDETNCLACPAGQYQPLAGSKSCLICSNPLQDPYCLRIVYSNTQKFRVLVGTTMVIIAVLVILIVWCQCFKRSESDDMTYRYDIKKRKQNRSLDIERQEAQPLLSYKEKKIRNPQVPPEPPPPDFY